MIAIIRGGFERFGPLMDLYRHAWRSAGHPPDEMKVGIHVTGFVADTTEAAKDAFYPGWSHAFTRVAGERGWGP